MFIFSVSLNDFLLTIFPQGKGVEFDGGCLKMDRKEEEKEEEGEQEGEREEEDNVEGVVFKIREEFSSLEISFENKKKNK
jgi:hypothetical protein